MNFPNRKFFASVLLMVMVVLATLTGTGYGSQAWLAGSAAWLAGMLLWPMLLASQKKQAIFLAGIGVLAFGVSVLGGQHPIWTTMLTQNIALLGMLGAVSFLQLLKAPNDAIEALPRGRIALWRTALGVHLLGAVINLSAVFIMAERIRALGKLRPEQAMILSRAFLAAALWSPFFAATAIALAYAPGANPLHLASAGGALAAVLLVIAVRDIEKSFDTTICDFVGYPIHLRSLQIPVLLSILVGAGHWLLPHWTALSVISLASLAIACLAVTFERGVKSGSISIYHHCRDRLPGMAGELVLFLGIRIIGWTKPDFSLELA